MKRKIFVSLLLIVILFFINLLGINFIEKISSVDKTILNAGSRGWALDVALDCMFCTSIFDGGCQKTELPDYLISCDDKYPH